MLRAPRGPRWAWSQSRHLEFTGSAGAREYRVEHRLGEPAGERVLLADVIARDELPWPDVDLGAVAEPGARPRDRMAELRGGCERAVPGEGAQRDDRAQPVQQRDLANQIAEAAVALRRRWLVGRWGASHHARHVGARERQAVAARPRCRLVGEPGAV